MSAEPIDLLDVPDPPTPGRAPSLGAPGRPHLVVADEPAPRSEAPGPDPADPVFSFHAGGKLEVVPRRSPLRDRRDLSLAYTPGVAEVCRAIAADAELLDVYTGRGNTVAVVTDGTAVLGLGDIGPGAAMPVMEGKAMLFKHFGGIDAVPICLDTTDVDEHRRDRRPPRADVRRDQPRGHLGAALLRGRAAPPGAAVDCRSSTTTSTERPSSSSPRS